MSVFPSPLVRGRLLSRYKRFLADVRLADGTVVTAHCANPGAMTTCLAENAPVWLSRSPSPKRKLAYTWEIVRIGRARVFVNPLRANDLVGEALERGHIPELAGYERTRREVPLGSGSRIDFVLERRRAPRRCWVEVKSVTLDLGGGRTAFPDSPTLRGRRHLEELIRVRRRGHRAVLLFCASREDAESVEPANLVDPDYGRELRRAKRAGVELYAYRVAVSSRSVELAERLPVRLPRRARIAGSS